MYWKESRAVQEKEKRVRNCCTWGSTSIPRPSPAHPSLSHLGPVWLHPPPGAQPFCSPSRRSEAGLPEFEKLPAGAGRRGHTHTHRNPGPLDTWCGKVSCASALAVCLRARLSPASGLRCRGGHASSSERSFGGVISLFKSEKLLVFEFWIYQPCIQKTPRRVLVKKKIKKCSS